MNTSIRDLKAKLSEHIRDAASGKDVSVSVHGKTVAKIVAAEKLRDPRRLVNEPGITWNGGKPKGLRRPERLGGAKSVSDMVTENRR